MKNIIQQFLKTKEAKYIGLVLTIVFVILLAFMIVFFQKAEKTADLIHSYKTTQEVPQLDWNDIETRNAFKKEIWLKNQLELSKDKLMSLGIDLSDSSVQIQFSGLPLIQCRIDYFEPSNFLSDINPTAYTKLFGQATNIYKEECNTPKRPIIKKKVVAGSDAEEVDTNLIIQAPFHWEFVLENNIYIVVNGDGMTADSSHQIPSLRKDKLHYRMGKSIQSQDSLGYYPVLFLWLDEIQAKALYRALPDQAKVIIRN